MSRSFKKHVMIYAGYYGDPVKKHNIDMYDDEFMISSEDAFYRKAEGKRYTDVRCEVAIKVPHKKMTRKSAISRSTLKKLKAYYNSSYSLTTK